MKTTKMVVILVLALGLAAEVANADYTFGTPTNLGPPVNSSAEDGDAFISPDGLSLYFTSNRPGGSGGYDIWVTTRATLSDPWGEPVNLGPTVNSSTVDSGADMSADGLTLYFQSNRPGWYGSGDIWVATRETTGEDWATPVNLGPKVNSTAREYGPNLSADGLELFFTSNRPGGYGGADIWVTRRDTIDDEWGTPVNLGPSVNSSSGDGRPSISADGRALFFDSARGGGYGGGDLWVTTRATKEDEWGTPVNLGPTVNSSSADDGPSISADGSTLFFDSERAGGFGEYDIYQIPIIPIVDFNGDGIVDAADMCIMVDHWHTDYPLCDIGPMPWGDGIVDIQDLIVLAEHLFEEIPPVE